MKEEKIMMKNVDDIILKEELYPREKKDDELIDNYAEILTVLPPIIINQDNIIIDGLHRLDAHKRIGRKEIECVVEYTKDDGQVLKRAVECNSKHGKQLSYREKKKVAIELFNGENGKELVRILSISPDCLNKWVHNIRIEKDEALKDKIRLEYLKAELKLQEVADNLSTSRTKVSNIIKENSEKINLLIRKQNDAPDDIKEAYSDILNFEPFSSDIWDTDEGIVIRNLLHYFTKPFDIVFANINEMVYACKCWCRRYQTGNKLDVKPKLVFLEYNSNIESLMSQLKEKMKEGYIAIKSKSLEQDREINKIMDKYEFKLANRVILPYSSPKSSRNIPKGYDCLLIFEVNQNRGE